MSKSLRLLVALFLNILCLSASSALATSTTQNGASIDNSDDSYTANLVRKLNFIRAKRHPPPPSPKRRSPPSPKKSPRPSPRSPPPPPVVPPVFPPVGSFTNLTVLPSNSWDEIFVSANGSSIYVRGSSEYGVPGDVYRSLDGGQEWHRVPRPTQNSVFTWSSFSVSKSSITLFVEINGTLWKSYDNGDTWKESSPIPCFQQPGGVTVNYRYEVAKYLAPSDDGNTVGAYYTNITEPYISGNIVFEERVCISNDGGATWVTCTACSFTNTTSRTNNSNNNTNSRSIPFPFSLKSTHELTISGDGSVLAYNSRAKNGGVLVSTNNLELVPLTVPLWPLSLSYNGSTVFGTYNRTLLLSNDRGATLKNLTDAYGIATPEYPYEWHLFLVSSDGTRLIAISDSGSSETVSWRSLDSGLSWTPSNKLRNAYLDKFRSAAGNFDLSTIFGAPIFGSLSKSIDFGATWEEPFTATTIQVSPDGKTVMAGNWLSKNGGSTWRKMAGGKNGAAICAEGRFLLATFNSTIYLSRNRGSTWKYIAYFKDLRRLVASAADCKRIVAISGIYKTHISTDGGVKWSTKSANISTSGGYWFTMSASWDAKKIAISSGNRSEMKVSINGGNTWKSRVPLPNNYSAVLYPLFSGDGSRLLAGTTFTGKLMLSLNDGADWQVVLPQYEGWYWPPTVQNQLASSYDGQVMYAVNHGKFMRSNTGGLEWEIINFPAPFISAVGTSQDGRIVYLLEGGGGIYASQDFGSNWKFVGPIF